MSEVPSSAMVLARALHCETLSLLQYQPMRALMRRTTWSFAGRSDPSRKDEVSVVDCDATTAQLVSLPLYTPNLVGKTTDGSMLVVVERSSSQFVAWNLTAPTHFTQDDVQLAATLMHYFTDPGLLAGVALPAIQVLTERQLRVLELIGEGLTSAAVGRRCGISERTVHKHLEQAYRKIGCHDRVTAVLFVRQASRLSPGRRALAE